MASWRLDNPCPMAGAGLLQLEDAAQAPAAVAVIQDGAQDQAAVAVTHDGAQDQTAVAAHVIHPPLTPPAPPPSPPHQHSPRSDSSFLSVPDTYDDNTFSYTTDPPAHGGAPIMMHGSNAAPAAGEPAVAGVAGSSTAAGARTDTPVPLYRKEGHVRIAGDGAKPLYRMEAQACQQLVDEPGVPIFAAAAPAVAANAPAVAGAQNAFDRKYFEAWGKPRSTCRRHNTAMKWLRQEGERLHTPQIVCPNDGAIDVPKCNHGKGTDFSFDESTPDFQWRWQSMIAQFSDDSLNAMFGPAVAEPSDDQVVCQCDIRMGDRPGFKMQRADVDNHRKAAQANTWDFVLTFRSGRVVHLHPDWNGTKVSAHFGTPSPDAEIPTSGQGGSDGPGTYRRFAWKGYNTTLRFRS
jgi:hypothetical protein